MGPYAKAAEYYDLLYARIRDYAADTPKLLELFRTASQPVQRVLDVACGTGRQAELLVERGLRVDGIDLEPAFVRIATARVPGGRFREGDMTDFSVAEPYDAVTCLFGSIGYCVTEPRLRRAIACLARAVRPGGIVVLEPWFEPGGMTDGYISLATGEAEGVSVCRMSRTVLGPAVSRIEFSYLVGERGGVRHLTEVHELGLFTRAAMESAFREAGLEPAYDPEGPMGRGLYVARRGGRPEATPPA